MLLGLFILGMLPLGGPAFKVLPFGWLKFLNRTLPDATINWGGVGMVVLCSGIMVLALQWFLNWLYPALSTQAARWPWRWTISLYAFFWILFGIVMGASGAMRHAVWLSQITEPIYKVRENTYVALRMASSEMESILMDTQGDIHAAQALLAASRGQGVGAWDRHQFVLIGDSSNRFVKALVIPREPEAQRKVGFVTLGASSPSGHQPIERLPDFLQ